MGGNRDYLNIDNRDIINQYINMSLYGKTDLFIMSKSVLRMVGTPSIHGVREKEVLGIIINKYKELLDVPLVGWDNRAGIFYVSLLQ